MPSSNCDIATGQSKALFPAGFVVALLLGGTLNPINSSIMATTLLSFDTDLCVTAVDTALLVSVLYFTVPPVGLLWGDWPSGMGHGRFLGW